MAGSLLPSLEGEDKFTLGRIDVGGVMRMSHTTLEGLHIFGRHSLFSVLNHTRTSGGERMLTRWLRQPLAKAKDINYR